MNLFCVGYIVIVMRPTFNWVPTSCESSLDKIFFSFKKLSIVDSLSTLPFSVLVLYLVWNWASPAQVARVSVSSYMCQSCWVWKLLFPCYYPSPLTLHSFHLMSASSLRHEGSVLRTTSHLGLSVSNKKLLNLIVIHIF